MLNEIAYGFSLRRLLDLFSVYSLSDTYVVWTDVANVISFALTNQKAHYNRKYQPLFIKVKD